MFRAFIDDTGNDPQEFAFNFGAWVARVDDWERFSEEWMSTLQVDPPIKYFRHHEAKSQSGQFENWSQNACDQKILSLAKVIGRRSVDEVYGIITGIRNEIITSIISKAVEHPKVVRSVIHASRPYDWCFHSIVSLVVQRQLELSCTAKVDFIFDKGDPAFHDCSKIFREIKNDPKFPEEKRAILGTFVEGDDKEIMPLQAADLLAGQSTAKLRGMPIEEPFRVLARNKRLVFCPIRADDPVIKGLELIVQQFNIIWSTKILERARSRQEQDE